MLIMLGFLLALFCYRYCSTFIVYTYALISQITWFLHQSLFISRLRQLRPFEVIITSIRILIVIIVTKSGLTETCTGTASFNAISELPRILWNRLLTSLDLGMSLLSLIATMTWLISLKITSCLAKSNRELLTQRKSEGSPFNGMKK